MRIVIFLGFYGIMCSSSATVLGNMLGKVNEGMCVCELSENDTRGGGDDFLVSLRIL